METEGEENAKKSEIKRNQGLIKIKFPSEEHARMVMISLQVDEELQPMKIERNISVDTNYLIM